MASQVRVTVKAADGVIDDFGVDAQPNWTIQQLKNHLYRHYPTHPPQTCQKLIHGGRLLLDQQTLQEALPDLLTDNVVIHLVAYERSASAPSGLSSTSESTAPRQPVQRSPSRSPASRQPSLTPVQEGREETATGSQERLQRETPQVTPPQQGQQTANIPAAPQGSSNPWLRYRGNGGGMMMGPNVQQYQLPPGMGVGQVQNFPMYMPMGGYPFPPQFYMSPYGAAYANQMAQWYNNYSRQPPASGGDSSVEREEDLDLPNPQDVANNNEEVENDVAMNAGALGMMAGGGVNFQNHRDLVDYLYMFLMAAFLALIAYVTGSFGRLLIFAGGIMFMLLNQAGWFSLQRRRPAVRQADPVEQVRAEQQVVQPQTEQGEGQAQDESQDQRNTDESDSQDPQPADGSAAPEPTQQQAPAVQNQNQAQPAAAEERPGLLATLFVFVTSFFTSLVPQQRPELQIN